MSLSVLSTCVYAPSDAVNWIFFRLHANHSVLFISSAQFLFKQFASSVNCLLIGLGHKFRQPLGPIVLFFLCCSRFFCIKRCTVFVNYCYSQNKVFSDRVSTSHLFCPTLLFHQFFFSRVSYANNTMFFDRCTQRGIILAFFQLFCLSYQCGLLKYFICSFIYDI